jgi:hypothetical protein
MKNLLICAIAIPMLMFLSTGVMGQIEVHDQGKITIGGMPTTRYPSETFINGNATGDGLYVLHNNFTPWSSAIDAYILTQDACSYNLWVNGATVFYVSGQGWLYCGGTFITSDSSIKKNIKKLSGSLDMIDKINGYNYNLKKITFTSGRDSGKTLDPDTVTHMGIMANEIQGIMPYAVKKMANGKLAVDYIQLIPLLIEGEKELDAKNKNLTDQLDLLQSRFNKLASSIDTSNGNYKLISNNTNTSLDFVLYQNSPNPWNQQTDISYDLKGRYSTASMYIFDLQGTLKKSYSLNGSGKVTIKSSELTAGMYMYSLVVDGKEIDTKRMILTN